MVKGTGCGSSLTDEEVDETILAIQEVLDAIERLEVDGNSAHVTERPESSKPRRPRPTTSGWIKITQPPQKGLTLEEIEAYTIGCSLVAVFLTLIVAIIA